MATLDQKLRELLGAKDVQILALQLEIERLREQGAGHAERPGGAVATTSPRPLAFTPGGASSAGVSRDESEASVSGA